MPDQNTQPEDKLKKWRGRAIIVGALLALVCRALPVDYRTPCETIASVCTGGLDGLIP